MEGKRSSRINLYQILSRTFLDHIPGQPDWNLQEQHHLKVSEKVFDKIITLLFVNLISNFVILISNVQFHLLL